MRRILTARLMLAECDRGSGRQALATAENGIAGVYEDLLGNSFGAVSDPNVQACTVAVTRAVCAYNWAQTLPAAALLPVPDPVKDTAAD